MFGLELTIQVILMGIVITVLVLSSIAGFLVINYLEKDTMKFCRACQKWLDQQENKNV